MPLTVFCQNRPPVWITDIEGIECSENEVILFTVEGDDPDGDDLTITFYSDDLPREVIFDDKGNGTGLFLWVPGFEDAGCYLANFVLSDNEFDVLLDIFITICNVNRPPWAYQFDEIPDSFQLDEGTILDIFIDINTEENEDRILTFSTNDLPGDATLTLNDDDIYEFCWQSDFDDSGQYTVTFILSDGEDEERKNVGIIVNEIYNLIYDSGSFAIPKKITLSPIYPNPFNSTTTIRYGVPIPSHVTLQVYNIAGQQISTLFEGYRQRGIYTTTLTATNLQSGLYFVRLNANDEVFTQKVMLIR